MGSVDALCELIFCECRGDVLSTLFTLDTWTVMSNSYYENISQLEKDNISRDYILGWASGSLGHPKLEEQRITDGYEAGYSDGQAGTIEQAKNFPSE